MDFVSSYHILQRKLRYRGIMGEAEGQKEAGKCQYNKKDALMQTMTKDFWSSTGLKPDGNRSISVMAKEAEY